ETITTQSPLSYVTPGYVDSEGNRDDDCSGQPHGLMVFACFCLGVALCGLVGNGRLLWFLSFHMKQSPFTVYILNLAIADFCLLLLFVLILLAFLTLVAFCLVHFLSFFVTFVTVIEFLCHFFDFSSLGLLAAISVDRCTSVL
ncbi:MRGX2 protein, partial [Upupa epops]|nr:MRGX2 protein [Upupa epops]